MLFSPVLVTQSNYVVNLHLSREVVERIALRSRRVNGNALIVRLYIRIAVSTAVFSLHQEVNIVSVYLGCIYLVKQSRNNLPRERTVRILGIFIASLEFFQGAEPVPFTYG